MTSRAFDSNILIDWMNGVALAEDEISAVDDRVISVVSWVEVLAGIADPGLQQRARWFMSSGFRVVPVTAPIAERALALRRGNRTKLLDAIIHATALQEGVELVTRNTKDFSPDDPTIRVPYQL